MEDLSKHHRPIGHLFETPGYLQAWSPYRLADEQVARYRAEGYLAGIGVLNQRQLESLCREFDALMDPEHPGHQFFHEYQESGAPGHLALHALGAWRIGPSLHDLLWNPAMTMPACQLLDGAVRLWNDQLFLAPAGQTGAVAWHQDYAYWTRTEPIAHVTCLIALDEVTVAGGCLEYVPGSHRWDLLPVTGPRSDADSIRGVLTDEHRKAFQPLAVELKPGQAVFHHPLTLHGAEPNTGERPRRVVVINMMLDGVKCASQQPLLKGLPPMPVGEPLGGRFFPTLIDPIEVFSP